MGIERCGKINAMNSGPESCTGIGVVAGLFVILVIREQLREKHERPSPESPIMAYNPRSWRVPSSRLLFAGRSLALVVFEPRLHELVEFLHLFVGVGFWRAVFQPTEHVSFD